MTKRTYLKIATILNLGTLLLHLIAGQTDLVTPLVNSNLSNQQVTEWTAVWHMVTVILAFSSLLLLKQWFAKKEKVNFKSWGFLYLLLGIPFIVSGLYFGTFAPQFILLMPIGALMIKVS